MNLIMNIELLLNIESWTSNLNIHISPDVVMSLI